ncbi:MAG: SOS response-associated peptidase family protein [Sphingomonadales bacterium]|nr:SOS response-associated peptidase family protein [Sphingomonadales bacterium]MBK7284334.1 SOS response-associated peptidase family protein [Sphingomonadales bacterium]
MCNLYRMDEKDIRLMKDWEGLALPPILPSFDQQMYPKGKGLILRAEGGAHLWDVMQWGVPMTLPGKRPGTTVKKHVTNVRNLESPFWRSTLQDATRRCLVPFTQFAEPRPGRDLSTGRPAQYWFKVASQPVAAFAGIWRPSEAGNVFAFLTCEPNPLIAPLHPKAMPVILHAADYQRWLSGENAASLAAPFPSQLMAPM